MQRLIGQGQFRQNLVRLIGAPICGRISSHLRRVQLEQPHLKFCEDQLRWLSKRPCTPSTQHQRRLKKAVCFHLSPSVDAAIPFDAKDDAITDCEETLGDITTLPSPLLSAT